MKIVKTHAANEGSRQEPLWRLPATDNGSAVIALLQNNLMEGNRTVPAWILFERLERDLEQLRVQGASMAQTAQGYVADWLARRWLTRRFPPCASEDGVTSACRSLGRISKYYTLE